MTILLVGCSSLEKKNELVIYTSVDQVFSSKIIKEFENSSGIKVNVLFDTEATKAVSLEKRLIAEKENPKADIFWNSEFMRTGRLNQLELFESMEINNLAYSKQYYMSNKKKWFGLGVRSRVFVVNKNLMKKEEYPKKLEDLVNPKFKGKIAIALPYSGSTSTHFAALYEKMGKDKFTIFIQKLKENNVALLGGNSVVKDAVGRGDYLFGLVDSDDALVGIDAGLPIEMLFYNQEREGSFSVYGTIAKIKNSPNPDNAKVFLNYILSKKVEQQMIDLNAVQYSVFKGTNITHELWSKEPDIILNSLNDSIHIMKNVFK
jgi:iron(III) transport system substrate-binding protein